MLARDSAVYLLARVRRSTSENRVIIRNMVLITGFVLAAKIVAAFKEMAIAWKYGISGVVDSYIFVFNLVNLPISIWFSILTVVFIPIAAKLRIEAPADLPKFRSELLGVSILVGIALGVLGWAALTGLFSSSLSGMTEDSRSLAREATPWLALLVPLGVITHYGSVLMMSEGRHANSLLEGVPALAILAAVLLAASTGMAPLIWGTLIGAFLHLLAIMFGLTRKRHFEWPRFSMRSKAWRMFWGGMGIMVLGQILQSITGIIDQFLAAQLPPGSIASLAYSNRILSLILTLGAIVVARATLPVFSQMRAENHAGLQDIVLVWAGAMFLLGIAIFIAGWFTAGWLVHILFERGAFVSHDTEAVSEVLRYGLLQLPFHFSSMVMVYGLLANGRYASVAAIAGINLVSKAAISVALLPSFGLNGLMIATAAMYGIAWICAMPLLRR